MSKCSCYNVRQASKLVTCKCGLSHWETVEEGYCTGTKECETCKCEGNTHKCDFYPEKRKSDEDSDIELLNKLSQKVKLLSNKDRTLKGSVELAAINADINKLKKRLNKK